MADDKGTGPGDSGPDAGKQDGDKTYPEKHVKELREENKKRRLENVELKESNEALKTQVGEVTARMDGILKNLSALSGKPPDAGDDDPVKAQFKALADRMTSMEGALATSEEDKAKAIVERIHDTVDSTIKIALLAVGLAEGWTPDDALLFVNKKDIKYNEETGNVEGIDEAVAALKKNKAPLFDEKNARVPLSTPGAGLPLSRHAPKGDEEPTMNDRLTEIAKKRGPGMNIAPSLTDPQKPPGQAAPPGVQSGRPL